MILSRIGWLTAVAVLCVAAIFFFPAIQGPYSAVNGPVTALQSAQAALRVRIAIVQGAFSLVGNFQIPFLVLSTTVLVMRTEPRAPVCIDSSTILRC